MVDLQQRYDLRPRAGNTKPSSAYFAKKMVPVKRVPEANVVPEVPITLTIPPKPQVETQGIKSHLVVKEPEKNIPDFNLELELQKIKIKVPLSELAHNPAYHPQLQKFLQESSSNSDQDVVNLQYEHPTVILGTHVED